VVKQQGVTKFNGVVLQEHELKTVVFLNLKGFNVELIKPSRKRGVRTPDLKMNGIKWEMKAPKGKGEYEIQQIFKRALRQAPNVIFDLRRSKLHQAKAVAQIERNFKLDRRAKRVIIITKSRKVLDLAK
jgi:hypothetical protein